MFDLAFLLMVSFIYATLTMTNLSGVDIVLPSGKGEQQPAASVIIAVAADNTITVDGGDPASVEEAVLVASTRAKNRKTGVVVEGDRAAGLGTAVEILAGLRSAGVERVSFLVENKRNEQPEN